MEVSGTQMEFKVIELKSPRDLGIEKRVKEKRRSAKETEKGQSEILLVVLVGESRYAFNPQGRRLSDLQKSIFFIIIFIIVIIALMIKSI